MYWLKHHQLILGSQSPRRKQLLTDAGFPFTQRLVDVEEVYPECLDNGSVAEYLSTLKSKAYKLTKDDILITADSIVLIDGKILGKPKDKAQGRVFLELLSNNVHHVDTGVTLRSLSKTTSFKVTTEVAIQPLDSQEIEYYLDNYHPYDKAGGYGIQDWMGICKVKHIVGSYSNVMGLPMGRFYEELRGFVEVMG